jgi:integrase
MARKQILIQGVTVQTRNGVQYYYARLGDKRKYCGKGEKGKELAEAARGKYLSEKLERRISGVGLTVKKPKLKTFADLSKWYMSRPQTQKLKSYKTKHILAAHLSRHFQDKALSEIDVDMLEDYRETRTVEGAQPNTINGEISLLRSMYNLAVKRKKIPRELKPGEFPEEKNAAPPRRPVTETEYEALLGAADQDFGDFLVCGYQTSMRSAEIANLKVKQVYLDVPHISGAMLDYLEVVDVKNGTLKTPPVSPQLKEVLQRRLEGLQANEFVFTDYSGPYYSARVSQKMEAVCKRAGVPYGDKLLDEDGNRIGVVFHSLRHTRVTRWVEEGWSDQIIMKASGHRDLAVYRGYVHLDASSVMRLIGTKPTEKRCEPALQAASQ